MKLSNLLQVGNQISYSCQKDCQASQPAASESLRKESMGCITGGRRPRTLTAIRLQDLKFTAKSVHVGSRSSVRVFVPVAAVIFTEEKFEDLQGHRLL